MSERVLAWIIGITVAAVILQTGVHLVNALALDYYWDALNADSDSGGPAWASSVAQFAAAFALLVLAARYPHRKMLLGLAGILAFFSLDDIVQVHERVSRLSETLGLWDHAGRLVWPAVFLPLLAYAFLALWMLAGEGNDGSRGSIRLGLVLLAAAVVLEIAAQGLFALDVGRKDWPFLTEVVVEEGAELAGWGLVVAGLAARLCRDLAGVDAPLAESAEPSPVV